MLTKKKLLFIIDEYSHDLSALGGLLFHLFLVVVLFFINIPLATKLLFNFCLVIFLAYMIRLFYFKKRPNQRSYETILEKIDASSFPSIHAFRIFSFVTILNLNFLNIWLSFFLYLIAVLVAYSRIQLKHHDFLDVFFGAVFGIVLGFAIYNF